MENLKEKDNNLLILINQFVHNDELHQMINEEDSIPRLSYLLHLLNERIKNGLAEKRNFPVIRILDSENECPFKIRTNALHTALLVQADDTELSDCLSIFNEKLSTVNSQDEWKIGSNLLQLLCISTIIVELDLIILKDIFRQVDTFKLKMFLFKMCGLNLNEGFAVNKASLFFKYFDILASEEFEMVDDTINYLVEQENFSYLCMLFDKKMKSLVEGKFFQTDSFWNFLKIHIISHDAVKKKQARYILWRTIEYFKRTNAPVPKPLVMQSVKDWDIFLILLEISTEKQLHLIEPSMKLLPSITNLDITWQICVYRELLNHSQLTVVYSTIDHILQLRFTYDGNHQQLLHYILLALNKFEYSKSSRNLFKKLELFCRKLPEKSYGVFFEEFFNLEWNPAAVWCVLNSASCILHKLPENLILNMLQCLSKIPYLYIKQGCLIFFIEKFLNDTDKIIMHFLTIGRFLISSEKNIYKQIFLEIMDRKTVELDMCGENLAEKLEELMELNQAEYVAIYSELMKKLNKGINYQLKKPYSEHSMVTHFHDIINCCYISVYAVNRLCNIEDDNYQYLSKFSESASTETFLNKSSADYKNIRDLAQGSKQKIVIRSYMIFKDTYEHSVELRLQESEDLYCSSTYDICKLWIEKLKKSTNKDVRGQLTDIIKKILELLDKDDENAVKLILDNLELLIKNSKFEIPELLKLLDTYLRKLCMLPNNSMRIYCTDFFKSIFDLNLFSQQLFPEYWKKWYGELFGCYFIDCESLLKIILEGCRKIILLEPRYANILTPLILSGITRGTIIQRNQRVEYGICQEIHDCIGPAFIQNPNMIAVELKMLSIECLYLTAQNNSQHIFPSADNLMEMLLDLYMQNYKKRYFPDSKIHLEKLRIVQSMLMLVYFTDITKDKLVQFILNSFCEESHQPSVKQLLQWLLIILVSGSPEYLTLMLEKVGTAPTSHVSSIVALIPVVFHLVLSLNDESYWYKVTDTLLPWTMGANFKLRVYSQITLRNILKRANKKQLTKYLEKYSFLEDSISTVLDATGKAVTETLKNDMIFIENFDPNLHYTVENIFVVLPKILGVPPSEWENCLEYQYSEEFCVDIENEHKLPSNFYIESNEKANDEIETVGVNIQKKIIPWKQELEESMERESLNSLICVASLVEKSSNLGGLSRTCEIFNIKHLVLHNIKIKDDKEFKSLSMSSENWVNFMEVKKDDLTKFLIELKEQGYSIVGLEQTSQSVKLDHYKFEKKTVLLLGNEKEGIPAPLLPVLDNCVEIPQFGQTRSLNVHVAGATCIWEYVKQHLL